MKHVMQGLKEVESAREEMAHPSFMTGLFAGRPRFDLVAPFPHQPEEDRLVGDAFCQRLEAFLREHVDPEAIERDGKIPREVLEKAAALGCFGMKIPREYGGLGLSQTNYNRALMLIGSYCNVLALLLSAHQSIGVSRPLLLFGTEEQKRKWLPRVASGAISAFALTEPRVGSDPANLSATAAPTSDGRYYIINGEKLWCTNGCIADVIVLMAKVEGKITAFVVEMDTPGIEVLHRCEFMGCRGIENAWLRFTDVRVPAENVIGQVGKGLRVALTTLNTGRVSLAALCLGMAKQMALPAAWWANQRETFGKRIGYHEINTHRLARMVADIYAMEAVTWLVSGLIDRAHADFRVESAVAKLFCSERLWDIADGAMRIRGGRGYETAASQKARGEVPVPLEQLMRDARLYLIGEGASDILKLFVAREVWDPHLKRARNFFEASGWRRAVAAVALGVSYVPWYLGQWLPRPLPRHDDLLDADVVGQLRYVEGTSRRLARSILYAMVRHREKLEQRQALVARFAEIGVDLFVIAASALYAARRADRKILARQVFEDARRRIDTTFRSLRDNADGTATALGHAVLDGALPLLDAGVMAGPWRPDTLGR